MTKRVVDAGIICIKIARYVNGGAECSLSSGPGIVAASADSTEGGVEKYLSHGQLGVVGDVAVDDEADAVLLDQVLDGGNVIGVLVAFFGQGGHFLPSELLHQQPEHVPAVNQTFNLSVCRVTWQQINWQLHNIGPRFITLQTCVSLSICAAPSANFDGYSTREQESRKGHPVVPSTDLY